MKIKNTPMSTNSQSLKWVKLPVEAIQWDVSTEAFKKITAMGVDIKPGEIGSNSFYIITTDGLVHVRESDWVIKEANGSFTVYKADLFEKMITPAPSDSFPLEFIKWHSGLTEDKIIRAYKMYLRENQPPSTEIKTS